MQNSENSPSQELPYSANCGETDWGTSGVIKARLWQLAEEKCIPLGATVEITLRCNLRCVHCYNFDRTVPYPKERAGTELTSSEIFGVVDQLAEAGCLFLSFTGGEALLHPDLDDFIQHARRRRMIVKVKSNGLLLTRERVERLVEADATGVDVSLYGATAETHDAFTVGPGSFQKTVEGIRNAKEAGLDVKVNICLVESNAGEMQEMIQLAEELEVTYALNPFITARYDGTTSSLDQSVDRATLEALYRGPLQHLLSPPDFDPNRSVQCACARANCGISATGEVYPCIGAPIAAGNLREMSFNEIWRGSPELNRIRALRLGDFKACKSCPDRPFCKRNSGVVYTNTGDYTGPEEFTCMDASIVHQIYSERQSTV